MLDSIAMGGRVVAFVTFVLVVGCGSGSSPHGDAGTDAGQSLTLAGTVIDETAGAAVAGATVLYIGHAAVVTDASGHFRVEDVTAPYDIVVRAGGTNTVRAYRGLTRLDPTLVISTTAPTSDSATLSGGAIVSGSASGDQLVCVASGPRGLDLFATATGSGTSPIAWSGTANWYDESSLDATIHCALHRYSGPTLTNAFYGSRATTLANGGSFTGQDVNLSTISIATVSGTLTDPASAGSLTMTTGPVFPGGSGVFFSKSVPPGSFSTGVAIIPGGQISVGARDGSARATSVLVAPSATVTQDVAMLARPTITAPTVAMSGVLPTAPITWNGGSGHLYTVTLFSGTDRVAEVVTTGTSAVLPDLAPFGLAYPAGGSVSVRVVERGMIDSTDAATNGNALYVAQNGRGSYQFAHSSVVDFTLAN